MADVPFPPPLDEGLPEEIHSEHVLGLSQTNINVNDSDVKVEVVYHSYIPYKIPSHTIPAMSYHIMHKAYQSYIPCHIIPSPEAYHTSFV